MSYSNEDYKDYILDQMRLIEEVSVRRIWILYPGQIFRDSLRQPALF